MNAVLQVGTLAIGRGQKARGVLPVAPRGDGSSIQLPLLAVAGAQEGPTLVVSGGVHGDEFEGPRAIQETWRELDPAQLRGIFVGVPVVNVPAFEWGRRESPIDGLNMNRIFPGRDGGFLSEQIAHRFVQDVVLRADYLVDLHAGGNGFAIVPTVTYLEAGDEPFREKEVALARAAGVDLLWKGSGVWSAAHVDAVRRGIPAILVELGQEGRCSPFVVQLGRRVIANVMKHANMLPGTPALPQEWTVVSGTYMHSQSGGCFYPTVQVGQPVRQGETVGVITDFLGDVIETVTAPYDGMVVSTRTFPSLRPGEWTTYVGRILEVIAA